MFYESKNAFIEECSKSIIKPIEVRDKAFPKTGVPYICEVRSRIVYNHTMAVLVHPEFDHFAIPARLTHLVHSHKAEVTFMEVLSYFDGEEIIGIQIKDFKNL